MAATDNNFIFPIRVYYEDTDAGGIVYHANYLKFFERARTEFLTHIGIEQDDLLDKRIAFVVKRIEIDNHFPARFNQRLAVHSRVKQLKKASVIFEQSIYNEDARCICESITLVACVNLNKMKPIPIPSVIFEEISRAK